MRHDIELLISVYEGLINHYKGLLIGNFEHDYYINDNIHTFKMFISDLKEVLENNN